MSLIPALTRASGAVNRFRSSTSSTGNAVGGLRTKLGHTESAVGQLRGKLQGAESALGKSRGSTDKFKGSLDKLRGSADKAKNALRDVKRQADAVEKSVGKASKNADKGGKSMKGLGKGLKGASLAQKGLNLAMSASPFGLLMTLAAPLIAQFVNMDKVTAALRRGMAVAWKAIQSSTRGAVDFIKPLVKGLGNLILAPITGLATALNGVFNVLAGVKISIPSWVPRWGGKSFGFPRLHVPVPHLAQGGVVTARSGGRLALIGEGGEDEAVIPLSRLERMLSKGGGSQAATLRRLAEAMERLAERPVHVDVDSQTIARAVFAGQRALARR
ncbi:hypothetical protein [Streptomyces sp. NBC_01304]|uniref:hypothetical protein n=1 Tax=Streptomyces sp. NBC_01304 TaxID=2903818 RepID=UPI002E0EC2F2|nr:hypothetical protein OG430_23920 [Streptomyces sp. NBC_01304]